MRQPPRNLLRAIPNLTLIEITESDMCCGSAGTYNLTQPEIAGRLGQRKANHILETGAEAVAAGNIGCIDANPFPPGAGRDANPHLPYHRSARFRISPGNAGINYLVPAN